MSRKPLTGNPYQLTLAELQWQPGNIPVASHFDDIYFSHSEGLAETEYVFLRHNRLEQRWRALAAQSAGGAAFTIGETGFGTGLNFLAAWRLWQQCAPAGWQLQFISTEKHPLSLPDLERSLAAWPDLQPLARQLLAQYPLPVPGHHYLHFEAGRVTLHLLLGDATEALEQLCATSRPELPLASDWRVDAWFLDGFAPAKNPSLWQEPLYQYMARLSAPGTTVATFTAVGEVRRGLNRCGFDMRKVKGFGSKREMLSGDFAQPPTFAGKPITGVTAPWHHHTQSARPRRVAVVGAGLAGCHTARALARRGIQVDLVDSAATLASGASGNPQGMLYTKLSPQAGRLNQFTLGSYLYALRHYRQLAGQLPAGTLDFCGVLQLAGNDRDRQLLDELKTTFAALPELVNFVDAQQASALAGIDLGHPGWFYPEAGWIAPPALCEYLAGHANIHCHLGRELDRLQPADAGWQLLDPQGRTILEADAVVIANSRDAVRFAQSRSLPLKTIRGQITQLPATSQSAALRTVICHEGYLTPAIAGHHHLGATFDLNDSATDLRREDHRRNLDSLAAAIPGLTPRDLDPSTLGGRAGLRCTSPDYLPLVGPVPMYEAFLEDYAPLRKNARSRIDTPGSYYPGLYLNTAHGSRGLTSTPLCAELLAATLNREAPPLGRDLQQALHPARFIIRDLCRNKI